MELQESLKQMDKISGLQENKHDGQIQGQR